MALYDAVLIGIFAAAITAFVLLLLTTAPYGRYGRKGWGPTLQPRWAWLVMESPAVFVILVVSAHHAGAEAGGYHAPAVFLLGLWQIHYVYRTFVYPNLMRAGKRRRFPILLMAMAIAFNTANGYVNGYALFGPPSEEGLLVVGPRYIIGVLLFVVGFVIHVHSDGILRQLRRPGESDYKVPRGGAFRLISSPNYFGEILQWAGFAVAAWNLAALAFVVFTVANLLPRALSHHRWYKKQFPDYPEDRRAIVPFLL